jgi:RNA polymerase sigma factor (sigma-70 family)
MRNDEFEQLYAEHAKGLLGFLAYRTGDRALAEDLLADTFERVLTARRGFDRRRGSRKAWVYSIALNRLRDHIRRQDAERRAVERSSPVTVPDDALEAVGLRGDVMAALARLSDDEREAVALRYGADLTVPEVARLIGEPLTTIEGRVYRALRKLRDLLGDD